MLYGNDALESFSISEYISAYIILNLNYITLNYIIF